MATAARPTLICGHTLNDLVHLLTDEERSSLTCKHCNITGVEQKRLPCRDHLACADCLEKMRGPTACSVVTCPDSGCLSRYSLVSVTEDPHLATVRDEVIKRINLKSKSQLIVFIIMRPNGSWQRTRLVVIVSKCGE